MADLGWVDVKAGASGPARVLLVEDNDLVRATVVSAVRRLGHEAIDVASAEEALETLDGQAFDVGLFDIELPGLSGVELLSLALERSPELAVLMLTGVGDSGVALECLDKGARTYLHKPLELGFLEWAINDALALRRLLKERNDLVLPERPLFLRRDA